MFYYCSVQFSHSVLSDSLQPDGLQHTRLPCVSITNSWSLLKLMTFELVIPSNHLFLFCPLLLLPSVFPSIRVFSNESVLRIRWPKLGFWELNMCTNYLTSWFYIFPFCKMGIIIMSIIINNNNEFLRVL